MDCVVGAAWPGNSCVVYLGTGYGGAGVYLHKNALQTLDRVNDGLLHRDVILTREADGLGPIINLSLGEGIRPDRVALSRCAFLNDACSLGVSLPEDVRVRLWWRVG